MIQGLCREAVELGQPVGGVARVGEQTPALAEHLPIETHQRLAQSDVRLGVREIAVDGAAQLVGGPVLVNEPGDLVLVAHEVSRKLRSNHQIDRPPVASLRSASRHAAACASSCSGGYHLNGMLTSSAW